MTASPISVHSDHVLVTVRLTPNARDDRIEGVRTLVDGKVVLAVRVRAIPEDGAANRAIEALVAKAAGVAKGRVSVRSGHTNRVKILRIDGDGAVIDALLAAGVAQR